MRYSAAMALEIIPSMDLRGGRIVRLQQGDYGRQINYDADPRATAERFRDAGAEWMHVVDLDGAKEGKLQQTMQVARLIEASGLKVQVGGGIRSTEDIRRLLLAGAERVVVGTAAFENWDWFKELVQQPDMSHRLVLAIDAKEGIIATRGWTASSGRRAVDVAREVTNWPLAALLYTDVAKDGMMSGPNLEQTRRLGEAGDVPVIASGGVGNISHISQLSHLPVWGVIVGRSLYEGTLDLGEAISVGRGGK
jgi:phosphoribosylformimino-5-aminoimidazole carboxamide ribotide isomerase